jgi:hypothetical protein
MEFVAKQFLSDKLACRRFFNKGMRKKALSRVNKLLSDNSQETPGTPQIIE